MSKYRDTDEVLEQIRKKLGIKSLDYLLEAERQIVDAIQSAPSIDIPQWIPCSERLPSENGRYLVVYPMLINKPWVSTLWYGKPIFPEKDEPCFYASDDEYGDVEYSDVIAWMPLPKPYGEREGE